MEDGTKVSGWGRGRGKDCGWGGETITLDNVMLTVLKQPILIKTYWRFICICCGVLFCFDELYIQGSS